MLRLLYEKYLYGLRKLYKRTMDPHPYTKFIHSENQDILWGLFKNAKFIERPHIDQNSESETELKVFFKNEIRNYYTSQLIYSKKPCSSVRELFEINRDALAHLFSASSTSASPTSSTSISTYEIPIGINVIEEKKRQQEMQQDRFASFSTEYHQMLARPAPKIDAMMAQQSNALNDEKIKNMDELLEQQMQARKEDERQIAALMKPPSKAQTKPLKIDYGSEKSVSWDPVVEVVNI